MAEKILFPTFNISINKSIDIVKHDLENMDIPFKTRTLAIDHVAHMATHNSITKSELVSALRWLFDHYDFEDQ
ncbi:hypothetical protein I4200191B4_18150 [Pseudoflavonifractor gallinarum]|uniref:hypothetical protein n=1 Tax=Pseudoflavonifractor gallinarum TaxID=2779352 RepID=UPI0036F38DFB